MLCLFRNSHIHPRLDPVALALSWAGTLFWLHFAFVEKDFWHKIQTGNTLIIDLVFGLPLVFAFAVMVYASIYWLLKLLLVLFLPAGLVSGEQNVFEVTENVHELETQYGDEYWEQDSASQPQKNNTPKSLHSDENSSSKSQ